MYRWLSPIKQIAYTRVIVVTFVATVTLGVFYTPRPAFAQSGQVFAREVAAPWFASQVASTQVAPQITVPRFTPQVTTSYRRPDAANTNEGTGFGSQSSVICSSMERTRHVLLAYLLPKDYASSSHLVHGDRYLQQAPALRQAFYDASETVNRRAGELAPGTARRIRVLCTARDIPVVLRIVLPRTAAQYQASPDGFNVMRRDLEKLGYLPEYDAYDNKRVPAVRRLLGYYDADFALGVAGQGTMFRRSKLLEQGLSRSHPLATTTKRNINNSPPQASFAVQYGTRYFGSTQPDPPLYTHLLHELSHTMGAVQDEPPTSSLNGHCIDGLDVMCYDDGGSRGPYSEEICPTAQGPDQPHFIGDEKYDCNGDTYFHPAPKAPNPLAAPGMWNLAAPANETFTAEAPMSAAPLPKFRLKNKIKGTRLSVQITGPARKQRYEVSAYPVGKNGSVSDTSVVLRGKGQLSMLKPRTTYDFAYRLTNASGSLGASTVIRRRTGMDTTAPSRPGAPRVTSARTGAVKLSWSASQDNVAVRSYRIERRVSGKWRAMSTLRIPAARAKQAAPIVTTGWVRTGKLTRMQLRVIALDGRNNRSAPSAARTFNAR